MFDQFDSPVQLCYQTCHPSIELHSRPSIAHYPNHFVRLLYQCVLRISFRIRRLIHLTFGTTFSIVGRRLQTQ